MSVAAPTFAVAAFDNAFARRPRRLWVTWTQLVSALSTFILRPGLADKRVLPAWSPVQYPPDRDRSASAVEWVSCLVLDYDDGTPVDQVSAAWADWPHVVHTSWSHTTEHPKTRLVLPLEEPVPGREWAAAWGWAERLAQDRGLRPDPHCKDPGRLYFRPAIRATDWPHEARVHDPGGRLLCLEVPRPTPLPPPAPRRARNDLPDVAWRKRRAVLRVLLAEDARARRLAADLVGARVQDNVARDVVCPRCGRPDVWWLIEPQRPMGARCNHERSCGWRGSLIELLGDDNGAFTAEVDARMTGGMGAPVRASEHPGPQPVTVSGDSGGLDRGSRAGEGARVRAMGACSPAMG